MRSAEQRSAAQMTKIIAQLIMMLAKACCTARCYQMANSALVVVVVMPISSSARFLPQMKLLFALTWRAAPRCQLLFTLTIKSRFRLFSCARLFINIFIFLCCSLLAAKYVKGCGVETDSALAPCVSTCCCSFCFKRQECHRISLGSFFVAAPMSGLFIINFFLFLLLV